MAFAVRGVVLQGSRFVDFVWEIHFGSQHKHKVHLPRYGTVFVFCVGNLGTICGH